MLKTDKSPILFVPHGGGPMPLMNDPAHQTLIDWLTSVTQSIREPKAILVISAHWEAKKILVSTGEQPKLIFDYYGFPPETYTYQYPAPGDPELAENCLTLLREAGLDCEPDPQRGFDHGTFVPLMLMYPKAEIPIIQVSLHRSLDPLLHILIGQAISKLRNLGVMIVGSGMSFHNMNAFFNASGAAISASQQFDTWLVDQLCGEGNEINSDTHIHRRLDSFVRWTDAPAARFCHPREEHLLPLLVCLGAAEGRAARVAFSSSLLNMQVSGFCWD